MKPTHLSRRQMLQRTALGLGAALAPALAADPAQPANPPTPRGFKLGGVDWELGKAADPETLAVAARLGFDGLQVDLGDVFSFRDPAHRQRHLDAAARHQIAIASLALGILSEHPLGRDPKALPLLDAAIDIAQAMRQRVILLAFFGKADLGRPENKFEPLIASLKEIAPKAEKAGVVLGIETEIPVARYRELVDKVGSPAVQVYFDTVHAHIGGGDIEEEIKSLAGRICEFHAKDCGQVLLGQGQIDFRKVRRGMDAIGYRGWLVVEQWAEVKGDKPLGFDETHRRNLKYLRELFPAGAA